MAACIHRAAQPQTVSSMLLGACRMVDQGPMELQPGPSPAISNPKTMAEKKKVNEQLRNTWFKTAAERWSGASDAKGLVAGKRGLDAALARASPVSISSLTGLSSANLRQALTYAACFGR